MYTLLLITGIYFALGALLVTRIVRHYQDPKKIRESWTKYLVYLFVVGGMITLIQTHTLRYASAGIAVLALYELFQVGLKQEKLSDRNFLLSLPLVFFMVYCFLWYADRLPAPLQLYVYALVFTFDGFSQLAGQLLGKHPLAPRISPAKTIEGLAGGFIFAGVTAFIMMGNVLPVTHILVTWTGTCLLALGGDLYTSYIKRLLGVKDYSRFIPGHGGILDRFDSLLGASVFLYVYSYCAVQT